MPWAVIHSYTAWGQKKESEEKEVNDVFVTCISIQTPSSSSHVKKYKLTVAEEGEGL